MSSATPRRKALGALAAGSLVVVLTVSLLGCSGDAKPGAEPSAGLPTPTPSASSTFGTYSEEGIPFAAGTYKIPASAWSVADFWVTFPDGWTTQYGHLYAKPLGNDDEIGFYAVVVDDIFDDACRGGETRTEVGVSVDDLVRAIRSQPGPSTSEPVATRLGGYPAVRIEFRVPPGFDLGKCRLAADGVDGLQIWQSVPADKYFVLLPGSVYTAYVLDVSGERQVFLTWHPTAASRSGRAELRQVLDSIRIEPAAQ